MTDQSKLEKLVAEYCDAVTSGKDDATTNEMLYDMFSEFGVEIVSAQE